MGGSRRVTQRDIDEALKRRRERRARATSRLLPEPAPEEEEDEDGGFSRLLGAFANVITGVADVIPDPVKGALGTIAGDALSAEEALNVPGLPLGTAIREALEGIPDIPSPIFGDIPTGRIAGEIFDIGLSPVTLGTAFAGPSLAVGIRGITAGTRLSIPGRVVSSLARPIIAGGPGERLLAETMLGVGGVITAEEVAERGAPLPVVLGAGLFGGVFTLYARNVLVGATRTIRRDTSKNIARQFGFNIGDSTFAPDLVPLRELMDAIRSGADLDAAERLFWSKLDPSRTVTAELGRALFAYGRQVRRGDQLAELGSLTAVAVHQRPGLRARERAVRGSNLFQIDEDGLVQNVRPVNEKLSRRLNDIISHPDAERVYRLTSKQMAVRKDFLQYITELGELRAKHAILRYDPAGLRAPIKGWLYAPRHVRTVKGLTVDEPPDSRLFRMFQTAEEAAQEGIDYSNDLVAISQLHARTTYREIALKQFEAEIAPLLIRPKDVLSQTSPEITERFIGAANNLRAARRGLEGLEAAPESVRKRAVERVKTAETKLGHHRKTYLSALKALQTRKQLPEFVFGRSNSDAQTPVGLWRGKFLRDDGDYELLAQRMDTITGRPLPVKMNPFAKGLGDVVDAVRFYSATTDLAMPFIQGLPLLGQNPVLWAKMTIAHYRAFFQPSYRIRYLRQHLETLQEMAQHGVPIGDVEELIALKNLRTVDIVTRAPGIRQLVTRSQAAYDTGLTAERDLIWTSLKPVWDGTPEQLATHVRNMSGALDSAALGITPTQRALESAWLGFSPRLMRSTLALVASAANPGTPEGRQAARALLGLAAAATTAFVTANIGIGIGQGKSEEEILERIEASLDPTGGRKFLALEVGGQWIGVGGQVRAISQFAAKAIANPAGFATADQFDNPLINFYMSRGAVGTTVVGGTIEALTGERINILSFDTLDSPADLPAFFGDQLIPFAIQSQFEAEQASGSDRIVLGLSELGGLRGTQATATDLINREAEDRFGLSFAELSGVQQQELEKEREDLFDLRKRQREKFGGREERARRRQLDEVKEDRLSQERILSDLVLRGEITPFKFRDEMQAIQRDAVMKKRVLLADIEFDNDDADENKQALNAWYDLFDEAGVPGTEIMDFDLLEALETQLFTTLTPGPIQFVEDRRRTEHAPEAEWYFANEEFIRESGYWDALDEAFDRLGRGLPVEITSYAQLRRAASIEERTGDPALARRLAAALKRIDAFAGRLREQLRIRNPELDVALLANGRVTVLKTARARSLLRGGE